MAVGWQGKTRLLPVAGVRLGVAAAGIRKTGKPDLMVMELTDGSTCAAVFTRNLFCAAPVIVAREHLVQDNPRLLVVNAGNANAGTGAPGLEAARASCQAAAALIGCDPQQVLPFSTGVIGELLPVDRIRTGLPLAISGLSDSGWDAAAQAIMTTDTVAKAVSRQVRLADGTVTITGIAKGSGMIRPDMATMLAYVASDATVATDCLQDCLRRAVEASFNRITVDGDTSTNDACVLVATGKGPRLRDGSDDHQTFAAAVTDVCRELAQAIVRDGEGATKFVTVAVEGGRHSDECLQVAYTIAHSPLVKTALFASDPNWGRILAAVGRAGIADLDIDAVRIYLGDVCIVRDGGRAPDYTEAAGQRVMGQDEITIRVELARGAAAEQVWTTDLSYEYVKINAEYRT
ncbi:MAG: bifunctional glutamate N-acetyltransferase/amino-acid acetyltransferase ArgJ [Gammaproteobacteria bacterium]